MLLEYIQAALRHAKYEILPDDGSYYGAISECAGVYANADALEDCRDQSGMSGKRSEERT
jgi:hypothetical protein